MIRLQVPLVCGIMDNFYLSVMGGQSLIVVKSKAWELGCMSLNPAQCLPT